MRGILHTRFANRDQKLDRGSRYCWFSLRNSTSFISKRRRKRKLKILVMADMEGASGVVSREHQARPDGWGYQEARRCLLSDVNAAVEGCLEGGAEEVVVFDMHFRGLNLNLNEIHPKARLIMGKPRKVYPLFRLSETFKGTIMIGYHAMAETEGGLLSHTYDYSIKKLYLNEVLMGEIGMEGAITGYHKVPLAMISGDSKAIEEGESLFPNFEKAVVKYAINEHSALCLPLPVTKNIIKESTQKAVERIAEFEPYIASPPYTIKVEFFDISATEKAIRIPQVGRVNDVTVEFKGDNLPSLWENFIGAYQGYQ